MFKINSKVPSTEDDVEILADFIEIKCLISAEKKISVRKIINSLSKVTETFETSGIQDNDDLIITKIELISAEFQRRSQCSGNRYPFNILRRGEVLEFKGLRNINGLVYSYLLFATRLNMNENRSFKNIDGTDIFEKISSHVIANYFGLKSNHFILGTSIKGTFEGKINDLCKQLGEGVKFINHNNGPVHENDDKVDIVVWLDFSDKKPSKFIGFGQCKTGTNWENSRFQLQPIQFCKKWLYRQPAIDPIRIFFVADIVEDKIWYKRATDAGLLFDRLRIMDYLPETQFSSALLREITTWTKEAIVFTQGAFTKN